jgi:hypothetical protein
LPLCCGWTLDAPCAPPGSTGAYLVSAKGAAKLRRLVLPLRKPLDMHLRELAAGGQLELYAAWPPMARPVSDAPSDM